MATGRNLLGMARALVMGATWPVDTGQKQGVCVVSVFRSRFLPPYLPLQHAAVYLAVLDAIVSWSFMFTSQDLHFFVTIAASPSLAAAGRVLDVSASAVSQRLQLLEDRVGLRLVERGVKGLRLTSQGEALALRAAEISADIKSLDEEIKEWRGLVSGPLKVIAPFGFGRVHVAPVMAQLQAEFPGIILNLSLREDPYGAVRTDNWDVIVHVGRLPDSSLTHRKLAPNHRLLCASPSYRDTVGLPSHPDELGQHLCGVIREDQADVTRWVFKKSGHEAQVLRIHPRFASNDGEVVRAWALAGLGIVERSEWDVASDLQTGRLVHVLPGWQLQDADVVAILSPRTQRTARTERFIEILHKSLHPPPWRR